MKASAGIGKRKWVIIPLRVVGGLMQYIDYKLPASVVSCEGFMLSVLQPLFAADFRRVGELSIEFNTRKDHSMQLQLDFNADTVNPQKKLYKLDTALTPGSIVSGYYRDFSGRSYMLNIYLACRLKPELP